MVAALARTDGRLVRLAGGGIGLTALAAETASKRDAILGGARNVFLREGFEGASMDAVAAAAGVSKRTVYRYFESKERLFAGLVETQRNVTFSEAFDRDAHDDPRNALRAFAERFLAFVFSPAWLAFHRMVIAESTRFPAIAREFHESGPERTTRVLAGYLERHAGDRRLRIDDPRRDAEAFLDLLRGLAFLRALAGIATPDLTPDHQRRIERALALVTPPAAR